MSFTSLRLESTIKGQIEGLVRFRLEDLDLLEFTFFVHLKLIPGEVGCRPTGLVQHAGQDVDQVHIDAYLAPLLGRTAGRLRVGAPRPS